jgi:hypothetical protein
MQPKEKLQMSSPALTAIAVRCGSCNSSVPEADLSTCPTCDAKFCGDCSQCDCDRIREVFEDLNGVANRTGTHSELLAHLRVTLVGLRKMETAGLSSATSPMLA